MATNERLTKRVKHIEKWMAENKMEQEKITKIRYKKECTECGMMIKGNSPQTVNYNLKAHSMQKHNKQEEDKNEEDDKQNQE